jgi:hypothetical protein
MPLAWECADNVTHGAFLQTGIESLQKLFPAFRRGAGARARFACPVCCADNRPGFVKPASSTVAARLAVQSKEHVSG